MRVLVPLPDRDFDTTEVAVPWRVLTELGHTVTFATERGGAASACDPLLLTGVLFGRLGARADAVDAYRALVTSPEFVSPISWAALQEQVARFLVTAWRRGRCSRTYPAYGQGDVVASLDSAEQFVRPRAC
jgi:putative intracellular protease/amidase